MKRIVYKKKLQLFIPCCLHEKSGLLSLHNSSLSPQYEALVTDEDVKRAQAQELNDVKLAGSLHSIEGQGKFVAVLMEVATIGEHRDKTTANNSFERVSERKRVKERKSLHHGLQVHSVKGTVAHTQQIQETH